MLNKKSFIILMITLSMIISLTALFNIAWADEDEPAGDEEGTFISVAPDALIVLDLSGSMKFSPDGNDTYIYGSNTSCVADATNCNSYSHCSGGFCDSKLTNCGVDCSRLAIAKRALFNILDSDNNGTINSADSDSLGIRIGFMRFKDIGDGNSGNDTAGDYTKGSIKLVTKISELTKETGTSYSLTYCGNSTSCASTVTNCSTGECIVGETYGGGTPIASALNEAKKYLNDHKASDPEKDCRQKFVILITDGADTYACPGSSCSNTECKEGCGCECQPNMYKRRREVVAATKALYNAGYKVLVIGLGSGMPSYLTNTLNWAAYYGGTDNTLTANSGNTSDYNIPAGSTYPSGISSCATDTAKETATCYSAGSSSSTANFKATNNDPGYLYLSGYAFIASTSDELQKALAKAMLSIRAATYSFTQSSIQAVRTIQENYVYEASFEPQSLDPFWIGHLKQFKIDDYGYITAAASWDAGAVIKNTSAVDRSNRMWTIVDSSGLKLFNTTNVTDALLDVSSSNSCTSLCTPIINFIKGGDMAYDASSEYYGWKLGDIFHTSPLSIATPNDNFSDQYDTSGSAWTTFLGNNPRTVANGKRIIIVGANDGQLHAFKALDGSEVWSFIPPNLLSELQTIAHTSHSITLPEHNYFVDGPLSAADIWLGTGGTIGSTNKSVNGSWKTYLITGEGRGGIPTLWSSSAGNCISDFNQHYTKGSNTYCNYCGFYAFDITDTSSAPVFKWRLGGSSALSADVAAYLGQAWSKMYIGRVRINNIEKWVGFIGGGYSGTNCSGSTCDTRGKGFFVVDLSDGTILKSFTRGSTSVTGDMNYDFAAGPTVVDYDSDGFLDTAYIGDLGGNIWRFKFCLASDDTSSSPCTSTKWSGSLLYANSTPADGNKAIYSTPAVSFDAGYNLWVFAGTGNKTDPTGTGSKGRLLAIKDGNRDKTTSTPYTLSSLINCEGWYYDLTGTGEKILSESVVYDKKVYFTSYLPASAASSSCSAAGSARLYILDYSCGGVLSTYNITTGGIPSAPVVSINPSKTGKDVYVSMSEEANTSTKVHTLKITDPTPDGIPAKTLRYWRDLRVQ